MDGLNTKKPPQRNDVMSTGHQMQEAELKKRKSERDGSSEGGGGRRRRENRNEKSHAGGAGVGIGVYWFGVAAGVWRWDWRRHWCVLYVSSVSWVSLRDKGHLQLVHLSTLIWRGLSHRAVCKVDGAADTSVGVVGDWEWRECKEAIIPPTCRQAEVVELLRRPGWAGPIAESIEG